MPPENVIEGAFVPPAEPQAPSLDLSRALATITQWRKILNVRLLALFALIGAMALFGVAMSDPEPLKLWLAGLYSVCVLWPVMALYLRKG